MEQGIVFIDGLVVASESELTALIEDRREKLRAEKEKEVKTLLNRIALISKDKKVFEICKEFGVEICLVDDELCLNLDALKKIIVYRIMSKELCPAAEFGLCIGGLKDLISREKCEFCMGYGTAEYDCDNL